MEFKKAAKTRCFDCKYNCTSPILLIMHAFSNSCICFLSSLVTILHSSFRKFCGLFAWFIQNPRAKIKFNPEIWISTLDCGSGYDLHNRKTAFKNIHQATTNHTISAMKSLYFRNWFATVPLWMGCVQTTQEKKRVINNIWITLSG